MENMEIWRAFHTIKSLLDHFKSCVRLKRAAGRLVRMQENAAWRQWMAVVIHEGRQAAVSHVMETQKVAHARDCIRRILVRLDQGLLYTAWYTFARNTIKLGVMQKRQQDLDMQAHEHREYSMQRLGKRKLLLWPLWFPWPLWLPCPPLGPSAGRSDRCMCLKVSRRASRLRACAGRCEPGQRGCMCRAGGQWRISSVDSSCAMC
jgi:hypothetical protein